MDSSTAHSLFRQALQKDAILFAQELDAAPTTQHQLLKKILWKNRDSSFGLRHGFDRIHSFDEYRNAIPLSSYEDYLPHLEAMHAGRSKVLVSEQVLRLHLSSGTSSPYKYIPFTASLACEFQSAIAPWLVRMYDRFPDVAQGRAYWALTPPLEAKIRQDSALPIGFDSEESYLNPRTHTLLPHILINTGLTSTTNPALFFHTLLLDLVKSEDLTWLSVWSPAYLLALWEHLLLFADRLLAELHERGLREPDFASRRIIQRVTKALADKRLDLLWPSLQLLSCWTDAWAAAFVEDVKRLFPTVPIERKGLMATEGVITIPWCAKGEDLSPILAYRSHVFEFLDPASLQPHLPHELKLGEEYEVAITTSGGYYRYRIGDMVRCEGFEGAVPRLRFQGRAGVISDLCGEKLNEYHVQRVLKDLSLEFSIQTRHQFLSADPTTRRYLLCIEPRGKTAVDVISEKRGELLSALDARLKENVHYHYCRRLGQLKPPDLVLLEDGFRTRLTQDTCKRVRIGVLKTSSLQSSEALRSLLHNHVRGASAHEN